MAELEKANQKVKQVQAQTSNAPSPSSTTDFSFISMSDSRIMSPEIEGEAFPNADSPDATRTKSDVQDWIAKARESIQAFDGYINMGGSSVTRSALVADEGSDQENGEEPDETSDYGVNVNVEEPDEDGELASGDDEQRYASPDPRQKRERLATVPSPAAPFGLMAQMTLDSRPLRRMKSKSSVGAEEEEEEEDVGLANPDFFRPSAWLSCYSCRACTADRSLLPKVPHPTGRL